MHVVMKPISLKTVKGKTMDIKVRYIRLNIKVSKKQPVLLYTYLTHKPNM